MSLRFIVTFGLVLVLLASPVKVRAERAVVSGSAELRYAGQVVKQGGVKTTDAHNFAQQYSLLVSKRGSVSNGRLGTYNLALGYEWTSVDSEINGVPVAIDNPPNKLLYRGDVTLAPGGLPFRLHAFSYDMHQTSYIYSDLGVLFRNDDKYDPVNDRIITSISNGTHVISGVTLEAGVQNGHYQGQYRDLLAALPRVLIDYKQEVVKDVRGPDQQHYVNRDLAFVSLNKKNNWFHYRYFEHEDKLDSAQNITEDLYLLGTINHLNRRQWVNLTNWITVSADISYDRVKSDNLGADYHETQRYDVNFFAKAARTRWQLDNFTSYSRLRSGDRVERFLDVPFYARGVLNPDTSWRFELSSYQYRDEFARISQTRERDDVYLHGSVETFRQARYIVRPELELETKSGTEGEGQSGRATIELFSNSGYREQTDLFGQYSVFYATGTGDTGLDVSYLEQTLHGRVESQLNSFIRVGGEEKLIYGSGSYDNTVSDRVLADLLNVTTFDNTTGSFDDDVVSSKSTAFIEFVLRSGLKNRIEGSYDRIDSSNVSGQQYGISNRLDYSKRAFSAYWVNAYVTGDGMPGDGLGLGTGSAVGIGDAAGNSVDFSYNFASTLSVQYAPGRSSRFTTQINYEGYHYKDGTDIEFVSSEETYDYSFWRVNGQVRKLLVLGEILEYDKSGTVSAEADNLLAFSLFSNYYPTAHTLLSARVRYEWDIHAATETYLTFLSAGVNYSKFQVSLDYSYGYRPEVDGEPEVLEHKWEVVVRKTF